MRLGDGPWSPIFRDLSLTDKRFSHLGIVRIRDGNITVINSVGSFQDREKGVDEVSLDKFLRVAKSAGLFRLKSENRAFISDRAADYIGYPFDWSFDLSEEKSIYCTELLYVVLKNTEYENILTTIYLEQLKKDVIPLEAVSNSPWFDEILYIKKHDKNETRNATLP
jgi:hypothetical protein